MKEVAVSIQRSGVVLLAVVVMCVGCKMHSHKSGPDEKLLPAVAKQFDDVPAPIGFKLQESYTFDLAPHRMFLLKYEGKRHMTQVRAFYKAEMARLGWKLTCESMFGHKVFLDFEKDAERCAVQLEHRRGKVYIMLRSHR